MPRSLYAYSPVFPLHTRQRAFPVLFFLFFISRTPSFPSWFISYSSSVESLYVTICILAYCPGNSLLDLSAKLSAYLYHLTVSHNDLLWTATSQPVISLHIFSGSLVVTKNTFFDCKEGWLNVISVFKLWHWLYTIPSCQRVFSVSACAFQRRMFSLFNFGAEPLWGHRNSSKAAIAQTHQRADLCLLPGKTQGFQFLSVRLSVCLHLNSEKRLFIMLLLSGLFLQTSCCLICVES